MGYKVLFKQCGSDHYSQGRSGRSIEEIAVHYTGSAASARNNAVYFARNERQGASAHYFVDDISDEIYQSVRDQDTAWAVGDWDHNCKSISVEVVSAGEGFSGEETAKAAWLVQTLQRKYGIPDSKVIRHYDVSGKRCPAPYIDPAKWASLRSVLTGSPQSGQGQPAGAYGDESWWGPLMAREFISQLTAGGDDYLSGQSEADKSAFWAVTGGIRYGSGGSDAVRALQRALGVEADGYYGAETIAAHQTALKAAGHYRGGIDGLHGHETNRAVCSALGEGWYAAL